jgi:hypothetical protein
LSRIGLAKSPSIQKFGFQLSVTAHTAFPRPIPLEMRIGDLASTDLYDAQPGIPIGKASITLPPELPPDRKQKQRKQR